MPDYTLKLYYSGTWRIP